MLCINRFFIYFTAGIISVLLSFWVNYHDTLLNPDAICYLQSAENIPQGLSAMMSLCDQSRWPFYSLLIGYFSILSHLSLMHAAFILNGLFSLFITLIFIRIAACFTNKKSILWSAAFVILCMHELNILKQDIIRDHGFWFFYLLSLFFLLQYFKEKKWSYAVSWSGSLMLATLFRIEGLVFLLFIPFLSWLEKEKSWVLRAQSFLRLMTLLGIVSVIFLLFVALHPHVVLGRLNEFVVEVSHFHEKVIQHYMDIAEQLGKTAFGRSENDEYVIYFFTLIAWYVWIVCSALSFIYAALFVYSWKIHSLPIKDQARRVLLGYILINVILTFIFLVENQFLSKRYVIALSLTCMVWIPFVLNHFLEQWPYKKWPAVVTIGLISLFAGSSVLHFGYSKEYIHQAGDWLHENVAAYQTIYSNDYQLMYYSQHFGNQIFSKYREFSHLNDLMGGKWKQYDYLALHLNKKMLMMEKALLQDIGGQPLLVFNSKNKNGDEIRIYRRSLY